MREQSRARLALVNDDTTFLELMCDLLESMKDYEVLLDTLLEKIRAGLARGRRTDLLADVASGAPLTDSPAPGLSDVPPGSRGFQRFRAYSSGS